NNEQKVKSEIGNYYFLGERELQVRYSKITHYYSISNLKYLLSFSVNDKNEENQNHLQNVKKIYNDLLRDFCYGKKESEVKLNYYANKISQKKFDKKSGGHCQNCTFRHVCMEKEIHQK